MSEVSFKVEIERYLNKETGDYLQVDDPSLPEDVDSGFEFEYKSITLTISGRVSIAPANFRGHPDDWTPDESECYIETALDDKDNDWLDKLSKSEIDSFTSNLMEEAEHCREELYDSYDDYEPCYDYNDF